ncbi:Ataxin-10-like protein [Favolaschia claudopus]|uniref:Ataxin-10 homolog n=1 Tax=Favolaschia claudopus TaxID=2862362 RepID=A0AAW0BRA4_9AGAR
MADPNLKQLISTFIYASGTGDIASHGGSVTAIAESLESITATLDSRTRHLLGESDTLWREIERLWHQLSDLQTVESTTPSACESETNNNADRPTAGAHAELCLSLARFTRNVVAGVPQNQEKAYEWEPSIRQLLHHYTAWVYAENEQGILVARVLSQALANIVTGNEILAAKLWNTYTNLSEKDVVILRLLASRDPRTLVATIVMVLNCIDGSLTRMKILTRTDIGVRMCILLLDDMVQFYDADEGSDGARVFDVGYEIFSRIIALDLIPGLFARLSMSGEIITPHQTTVLKLTDSYLQASSVGVSAGPNARQAVESHGRLRPMLAETFLLLSTYAQRSIRDSLESPSSTATPEQNAAASKSTFDPPSSLDVMLPKASEALVLVTQCIVTITLKSADADATEKAKIKLPQDFFNEARSGDTGIVESLIELLHLLDLFLPRINFGKPVRAEGAAALPEGVGDATGFTYLKRDLVRLLGILCHGDKAVQDRARVCGGVEVVMNLCVIDERNPYLREHAIFALHNLLEDNPENQRRVELAGGHSTNETQGDRLD